MKDLKPASISLSDLTSKIRAQVPLVAARHPGLFPQEPEVSFLPDSGIIGFVINESDALSAAKFGDLSNFANGITKAAGPLAGPAQIHFGKGHVTVGFFPANNALKL